MNARIIIGANYGDEGKGTIVANYTKQSSNVLNVLTNGGAQRGHSILTESGNITFQHFGAGTYHGADNYYSCFYILNPMQFVKEYKALIVKPENIYRDIRCRWSTPYDSLANIISEKQKKRKASCGMGIWNTIKRYRDTVTLSFDNFNTLPIQVKISHLNTIKKYYEKHMNIPNDIKDIWNSYWMQRHFIEDCNFMFEHTKTQSLKTLEYDNMIFENGQGLLLCDTGKDTYDTTPSNTGIEYAIKLLNDLEYDTITAHYVTRPYLTRHGDGVLEQQTNRALISSFVEEDRTNHFNDFQGEFRYGFLDIQKLKDRVTKDAKNIDFEIELTHCDEMDRVSEFNNIFDKVNIYDTPLV